MGMSNVIGGNIWPGFGGASRVMPKLAPHLKAYLPDIVGCHPGTINVFIIHGVISIRVPDIATPPIEWKPNHHERFALTRINFEFPLDAPSTKAWILTPERTPHKFNASMIEVVTIKLEGIAPGLPCRIHTDRDIYWSQT
jgi:hypothetical protein